MKNQGVLAGSGWASTLRVKSCVALYDHRLEQPEHRALFIVRGAVQAACATLAAGLSLFVLHKKLALV